MLQDDTLLDFKDVMRYLKVSRSTVNRLITSGALVGNKVGYQWRFKRRDVDACVQRQSIERVA